MLPLQPAGALLLAIALLVAFVFAPAEVDAIAYAAAVTALAILAVCLVASATAALYVRWRLQPHATPIDVQRGIAVRTGFTVPSLRYWPLVQLRLQWETPEEMLVALEGGAETVTPQARGRHERVVRRLFVHDVFHLTQFSFALRGEQLVRVTPAEATPALALGASFGVGGDWSRAGGPPEGDLVEMRQYGPGDPMRRILWKTFARSRRLLVRMPEPAFAPRPVNVAFFVAGRGDEATAAVARAYVESGLLGSQFTFIADGALSAATNVRDAVEQIIESKNAEGGSCLHALATTPCIVFAPAEPGPWLARLLAQRLPAASTVLIGSEHALQTPRNTALERFFLQPETSSATRALKEQLQTAGIHVQVIHRASGQLL